MWPVIEKIDLHKASYTLRNRGLSADNAQRIKDFIGTKINNGTLYTPPKMQDYPYIKRLQLFINSNIAEHAIVDNLGGKLLEGNDILTLNSKAVIGEDRCALADVMIGDLEVEVKVTIDDKSKLKVLPRAHKKPIVAIYTIRPDNNVHWEFINQSDRPELTVIADSWQTQMNTNCPKLSLLEFLEYKNGQVLILDN